MFGSLQSLTGGGSMAVDTSSNAGSGDNAFSNGFNYRSSPSGSDDTMKTAVLGLLVIGGLLILTRK